MRIRFPDNGVWLHQSGSRGAGWMPPRFHTCDLPEWTWKWACDHNSSAMMVWASVTLSGSGVANDDVIEESHALLKVPQPRLCLDEGLVLS